MNFASLISAGFIANINKINEKYRVNLSEALNEELKLLISERQILKRQNMLWLNPEKYFFYHL